MKNHISGPFLQLNAWISWAVLIALLAWQSLFCHHVLFANWEGNFPICSVRVSIIWSFQLTLLPDCLIVTEAIQHHIKLHFNLLNLGNRISFGKTQVMVNNSKAIQLGSPAALRYSNCLGVRPKEPFTEGSGFYKEQRTCDEQPHSSPKAILDVFKIFLLQQYLNWSKWLCELRRKRAVCSALSISNELLPHIAMGSSRNLGFVQLLDFRFWWVNTHFANCICLKAEYENLFHPPPIPQHIHTVPVRMNLN